jgi:hypothetical protein
MSNLTLTQARTRVLRLLDEPNGVTGTSRNNPDGSFADIDLALGFALNGCLSRFCTSNSRFDLEDTGTTSATTGTIDLSAIPRLIVKGVAVTIGNTLCKIPEKQPIRRGYPDFNARAVTVTYVREYAIPTTASHPLVGVGSAAANSFPAFNEWICLCAAIHLMPTDNDQRDRLDIALARTEADVGSRPSTPQSGPWPRMEANRFAFIDLQWQWKPSTGFLYLVNSNQ